MFKRNKPMSARVVLGETVNALRRKMHAKRNADIPDWAEEVKIREDWTDAIWILRKRAMEERDAERVAYVKRYRPIMTLDGLDPDPVRLAYREMAKEIRAVSKALFDG